MPDDQKVLFAMDQPSTRWFARAKSPFIAAGWIITEPENPVKRIEVRINGEIRALASTGLRRPDVAAVYPDRDSLWCGFATEVFVDDLNHSRVNFDVNAVFENEEISIDNRQLKVGGLERVVSPRPRSWHYADVLSCPVCSGILNESESGFTCRGCQRQTHKRGGIPVFTNSSEVMSSHLLVTNPTNANALVHTEIIESNNLVLDLGAGNPRDSEHHPNVVFHEFVHYAHTDVVSVCDRLPYRDNVFDAVISKAAFEHLARPWEVVEEVYRVLKPGGLVRVDTAFMFPLHGDPYHFFNMTLDGVREMFKRFRTLRCGVMPYQLPSYGLRAQFTTMLDHLPPGDWHQRITEWRDLVDGTLDSALDARGIDALAAGVYFEGTKPR